MIEAGRTRIVAAFAVALAILGAVVGYTMIRDQEWQSTASVILVPDTDDPAQRTIQLDVFDRSGTIGTYVELLSAGDVTKAAGPSASVIEVRAIPDTRVIEVTATGSRAAVRDDVDAVIAAAAERSPDLQDEWRLETLDSPADPTVAGPSNLVLLATGLVLALLGALATYAILGEGAMRRAKPALRAIGPDATGQGVRQEAGRTASGPASGP